MDEYNKNGQWHLKKVTINKSFNEDLIKIQLTSEYLLDIIIQNINTVLESEGS